MAQSVFLCIVYLLAAVAIGSCTKCYQCNSQADPSCGEPFKYTKPPTDCSTDAYKDFNRVLYTAFPSEAFGGLVNSPRLCHKITLETGTIVRTCLEVDGPAAKNKCDLLKERTVTEVAGKKVKSCEVCDKDNCNGAGALSFSLPLSAITLLVSYLIYKQ